MSKRENGIGNIANRALVDVGRKSPGPEKALSNIAERAKPQGSLGGRSGGVENLSIGINTRGSIKPTGKLDNNTKKGPGCPA